MKEFSNFSLKFFSLLATSVSCFFCVWEFLRCGKRFAFIYFKALTKFLRFCRSFFDFSFFKHCAWKPELSITPHLSGDVSGFLTNQLAFLTFWLTALSNSGIRKRLRANVAPMDSSDSPKSIDTTRVPEKEQANTFFNYVVVWAKICIKRNTFSNPKNKSTMM